MREFKIRASASGKLMTKPRSKSEVLSKTTMTYLQEWTKQEVYGFRKSISSKYLDKGNAVEDDAIDYAAKKLGWLFASKNDEYFEDDFFCGTPDVILEDKIIDIKSSWDCFTFPLFEDEIPNKDYFYQLQVYMHLTGKKMAELSDPQKMGSMITYYRRYTLQSLLGLQAEDDDANAASKASKTPEKVWVNKGDKIWNAAIDKGATLDTLKKHYSISKENQLAYPYK